MDGFRARHVLKSGSLRQLQNDDLHLGGTLTDISILAFSGYKPWPNECRVVMTVCSNLSGLYGMLITVTYTGCELGVPSLSKYQ